MTILDIIEKKRDKKELTKEEIEFFINGYTNGTITDYQAAALIMAIFINGMTDEETVNLTFISKNALREIETVLSKYMMQQKRQYESEITDEEEKQLKDDLKNISKNGEN